MTTKEEKAAYAREWRSRPENIERARASARAWKKQNREMANAYNKRWRQENPGKSAEHSRRYHDQNRDVMAQRMAAWRAANPGKARVAYSRRRKTVVRATPTWVDANAIEIFYREAAERGMHVDHIVPLKGRTVCGLHVPWNLQLLSRTDNCRKSNKLIQRT